MISSLKVWAIQSFCHIGKNHKGAILTINDRATSRVWIRKLSGKEAIPVAKITVWALRKVKNLIHTITADNGKEFAKHEDIAQKLDINFYFCKPYHSWERGANENTNGLIRQYIPKGTDFSEVTNKRIKWIENNLNNRPRKRLGYLTPDEKFKQIINMNSVAFGTWIQLIKKLASYLYIDGVIYFFCKMFLRTRKDAP